jgi:hypothetical protein
VTALTPVQRRRRDRAESVIRLIAPALDLVLAAGDRLSRLIERRDDDYYPPQRSAITPARSAPPPREEP